MMIDVQLIHSAIARMADRRVTEAMAAGRMDRRRPLASTASTSVQAGEKEEKAGEAQLRRELDALVHLHDRLYFGR